MTKERTNTLTGQNTTIRGRLLIQSSAGTGKTHTIGSLTLRLLIGQWGEPNELCEPVSLQKILIVTFTNAATTELRERIQQRLLQAADAFAAVVGKDELPEDPFLNLIVECSQERGLLERDLKQLEAAIEHIDEMSVFTIHGFCYRLLMDAPFESQLTKRMAMEFNQEPLIKRAMLDFLRQEFFPLDDELQTMLKGLFKTPTALQEIITKLLHRGGAIIPDATEDDFASTLIKFEEALAEVKKIWTGLEVGDRINASGLNRKKGSLSSNARKAMKQWADQDDEQSEQGENEPKQSIPSRALLSAYRKEVVLNEDNLKKKGGLPEGIEPFCDAVAVAISVMDAINANFLRQATDFVSRDLWSQQLDAGIIGPSDIIRQVAKLLTQNSDGAMAKWLSDKYPVAFIDEFQDTDPDQWRIFSSIYPDVHSHTTALVLIGDPKQAIYAFRGADLNTYLHARESIPQQQIIDADVNWRSSVSMLEAVNTLYMHSNNPFANDKIHFQKAKPRPGAETKGLAIGEAELPSLNIWFTDTDTPSFTKLRINQANKAVDTLDDLLRSGATLNGASLQPSDIAFLVNDKLQAGLIQSRLKTKGYASIWRSNESVFGGEAARAIYTLLSGMIAPGSSNSLQTSLACPLLGISLRVLSEDDADSKFIDQQQARFQNYHELWLGKGFMAALQQLMVDYDLTKLIQNNFPDANRILTDLRHIGEILQQKTTELHNLSRIRKWFYERMDSASAEDDHTLQLESDDSLIRISTLHSAKGLEFNLVMLPFGVSSKLQPKLPYFLHRETPDGPKPELILNIDDPRVVIRKKIDAISEGLRLLYVGLTRAKLACFISLDVEPENPRQDRPTPMLHNLLSEKPLLPIKPLLSGEDLKSTLKVLQEHTKQIGLVSDMDELLNTDKSKTKDKTKERTESSTKEARTVTRVLGSDWRLNSYTSIKGQTTDVARVAAYQDESDAGSVPNMAETEAAEDSQVQKLSDLHPVAQSFPKGAHAGSCLHSLLENWPAKDTPAAELDKRLRLGVVRYGIKPQWEQSELTDWLVTVRNTPLAEADCTLADVNASRSEMDFYLPMTSAPITGLSAILNDFGYMNTPMAKQQLNGMLYGIIDFIFEHQGRYWVVDYKSNWLGKYLEDYGHTQMDNAVRRARYDMQMLFYALACSRLLRLHLGKTKAEAAFGGVYCLFLRGMNGEGSSGVYAHKPEPNAIAALDTYFAKGL